MIDARPSSVLSVMPRERSIRHCFSSILALREMCLLCACRSRLEFDLELVPVDPCSVFSCRRSSGELGLTLRSRI